MRGPRGGVLQLGLLGCGGRCAPLLVGLARLPAGENLLDRRQVDLFGGDQPVEFGSRFELVIFAQIPHCLVDREAEFPVFELAFQLLASQPRALGLLFADEGLDLAARLGSLDRREPVGLGRLVLLRENLDDVAVMERLLDRHGAAVDLAARTAASQIGVDVEGEVEYRGPFGELAQVAVGREDEDFARRRPRIEPLRQRMGRVLHQLAQAAEPHLARERPLIDPLVTPVRRDAAFGHGIHPLGADLNLHPAAAAGRNGGVERLVAVGLGDRNPVAQPFGIGDVVVGDDRVDGPALSLLLLGRTVEDDAQREDVVDPFERHVLLVHLRPDREDRLRAALDVVVESLPVEPLDDRRQKTVDEGLAFALGLLQLAVDMLVLGRFEIAQGDVLQLALDRIEAQFVRDLGVEVHALPALLAPLLAREHPQVAHHFEAVGQFDEDHARVFGVAHDQVAEVGRLLLRDFQPDLRDVAQPHGDAQHLVAEAAADFGRHAHQVACLAAGGEPHHVVQDGRQRGVAPQSDLGDDDACDACGVIQQRRSVVAHLFFKAFGGICQRLVDEPLRGLGKICGDERPQLVVTCRLHSSARF